MKIQKFVGATMREALAQVRNALGQEAVILSNRETPRGVELLAIAEQHLTEVITPTEADLAAVAPQPQSADYRGAHGERSVGPVQRAEVPSGGGDRQEITQKAAVNLLNALRSSRAPAEPAQPASARGAASPARPAARGVSTPVRKPAETVSGGATRTPAAGSAAAAARTAADGSGVPVSRTPPQIVGAAPLRAAGEAASGLAQAAAETAAERTIARTAARTAAEAVTADLQAQQRDASMLRERELLAEVRSLRGLMEQRFTAMAWHDDMKRRPRAAAFIWELLAAGFSTVLARAAVNAVPEEYDLKAARAWLYAQLVPKLKCLDGETDLVARGGVYAFTGPTGVGKTTTAAKIAARCVVKHGADSLGLITTDTYRIGAHDQLRVFGRILGVPVHAVHDSTGLSDVLAQLAGKRLVLVDTIGMNQRDERVGEQHQMLDASGVRKIVLMSATSQLETLESIIEAYATPVEADAALGAIITKIDEAVKLGSILDVLIRHRLPLAFVANGQRVPEDLSLPNCRDLVRTALASTGPAHSTFSADEATLFASWTMSERVFSGVAHA